MLPFTRPEAGFPLQNRAKTGAGASYTAILTMFFLRVAMQKWPRAFQFWIVSLVALQLVAPVWHVCALGGFGAPESGPSHHGQKSVWEQNKPLDPTVALICVCAPPAAALDPEIPRLGGHVAHDHATCLALLLQTMPSQIGAPPLVCEARPFFVASWRSSEKSAPFCASPRRFRGRAPPEIC
ncbi:MAG TPA: hypothetical protein VGB45_10915 [Abditibacterium sp.]